MVRSTEPSFDRAIPGASALLESLRGVGYSPWTAIADLVDNSVTAGARHVYIDFVWRGHSSYVRLLDDGCGMDETSLISAMRPGSRSPVEARSKTDLGRFGLGLKTASLSQCRLLTVISKRNGKIAARRWDLDYLARVDEWRLLIGPPPEAEEETQFPDKLLTGTLVLWSNLDRLVGSARVDDAAARARFFETVRHVERHLAMVFHRFLERPRPRLEIYLNNVRVQAWDPFMQRHPATVVTPPEPLEYSSQVIVVQGFVLPHKDMLTAEESELGGGPEGWLAHQGFFIYRNQRLLVPGGWLGLGAGRRWPRDDVHRLARLRLEIPNSLDDDWKIDIKKAAALPPAPIRFRLQGLAERVRSEARKVFAHRGGHGTRNTSNEVTRAWRSLETVQGVFYRIDREHPSVRRVLETVGDQRAIVEEMLRVVEATVPVQRIWLDTAERGDVPDPKPSEELESPLSAALLSLYVHMLQDLKLAPDQARKRLLVLEPFSQYPAAVLALPDHTGKRR